MPKARKQVNEGVPTVPPRVKSLVGCRFGFLVVKFFAGQDKHGKALWCCECDCGGILGSRIKRGALWVSSRDVSTLIAMQERQKKRCPVKNAWLAKKFAEEARPT